MNLFSAASNQLIALSNYIQGVLYMHILYHTYSILNTQKKTPKNKGTSKLLSQADLITL